MRGKEALLTRGLTWHDRVRVPTRWGALALGMLLAGVCLLLYHGHPDGRLGGIAPAGDPAFAPLLPFLSVYPPAELAPVGPLDRPPPPPLPPLLALLPAVACGLLLAVPSRGQRRWAPLAVVLLASPLLPATVRYHGEWFPALALVGIAVLVMRGVERRWAVPLAFAAALLAALSGAAGVAVMVGAAVWLAAGAPRRGLLAPAVLGTLGGMAAGWALAGEAWFSWPGESGGRRGVVGALLDALFSSTHGIVLFFPAAVLAIAGWWGLPPGERRLLHCGLIVGGCSLAWLMARGGLPAGSVGGPGLLLPALLLFVPALQGLLSRSGGLLRALLLGALAWSILLNWIYLRHPPYPFEGLLADFNDGRRELLAPWRAWLAGMPLPLPREDFPRLWRIFFTGTGLALVAASLYPVLAPWQGHTGTSRDAARPLELPRPPVGVALAGGLLLMLAAIGYLQGPRGWQPAGGGWAVEAPSHLVQMTTPGIWVGVVEGGGELRLAARSDAPYRIEVAGRQVLPHGEGPVSAVQKARLELGEGNHRVRVTLLPPVEEGPARFDLLWAPPPGKGALLPAGGQEVRPRPLTGREEFFTLLWQGRGLVLALVLALLLLALGGIRLPVGLGGR